MTTCTNYMLIKDQIGKHKSLPRDLPEITHSYGKAYRKDGHNVGALLASWQHHEPTGNSELKPDYKRMNRAAILNKVTSARAAKTFR